MATPQSKLAQDAAKWIVEAEADRRLHETWHRDVYRYAMPWRRRPQMWQQVHDQDELFDPTAIDALSDFAADLQNAYTPTESDWLDVEPAQTLQPLQVAQIKSALKQYQNVVFAEIRRSNFHEATLEAYPDFGAGTAAMCIQSLDINEPIHCQAIPITDLLIVRGVYGGVDFRARCLRLRGGDLATTYPNAVLPPEVVRSAEKNPGNLIEVKECFWRLRDKPGIERWQYVLLIAGQEGESGVYEGAGSCAIMCARWKTDSTTAWGIGPLYTTLPTIKTLDQLAYLILKHLNKNVDPVTAYDDDGIINLDQGLVPGTAIARQKGSKIDILESGGNFDVAFFERTMMQSDIKRSLFQDKPDQRGKTPPTASQWLDEKAQIDRRMGAPVGRLVTEWQWAIFSRFAYLLAKRGVLPEVKLNGEQIRLRPQSPLIRSQRQEEVVTAQHVLTLIGQVFGPQTPALVVDVLATCINIVDTLGADGVIKLRTEDEIKAMAAQAAQAAQAMQPQQQQGQAA